MAAVSLRGWVGVDAQAGCSGHPARRPDDHALERAGTPGHSSHSFATMVRTSEVATTASSWLVISASQRTSPYGPGRGLICLQVRVTVIASPGLSGVRNRRVSIP